MNLIIKRERTGSVNTIKKMFQQAKRRRRKIDLVTHSLDRGLLSKLLIICGSVPKPDMKVFKNAAKKIEADFVIADASSWRETGDIIRKAYDPGQHRAVLLIGTNSQLPAHPLKYKGDHAVTDWFFQDIDGDLRPDVPIGRVFGSQETVLKHIDPPIIDSDIAIIFDAEPNRTSRHVIALHKLGFDVEILKRFHPEDADLLAASEFILQFSDGRYTRRIHGNPSAWAAHNSVVLSHEHVRDINFVGYPVVFSEACSTAQEGPLLKAFLDRGACYIGAPLETVNNIYPFESWRECAAADGWKFGFLDLLDTFDTIGEVKVNVDINLFINLNERLVSEIQDIASGKTSEIRADEVLSVIEWNLFGNPLRVSTRGPNADYVPGVIVVDT